MNWVLNIVFFRISRCETHVQCKDLCVCWVNVDCQNSDTTLVINTTEDDDSENIGKDYENYQNAVSYYINI